MPIWVILLVAMLAASITLMVQGCGFVVYDNTVGYCTFEHHGIRVELFEDYNSSQVHTNAPDPGFKGLCDKAKKWHPWTKTDVEVNHG